MKHLLYIFIALALLACKKDPYIAEGNYFNPPKDSVSFGYRLTDLYFIDTSNLETHVKFKLDTGLGYFWQEILIDEEKRGLIKKYIPEYNNFGIAKLVDLSPASENIEVAYVKVGKNKRNLISTIKYKRKQNPIALQFIYNLDTGFVQQINLRTLSIAGDIGSIIEQYDFCLTSNLGACNEISFAESYQYGGDFNSLRYCNELAPIMMMLCRPDFQDLADISSTFPYYFSQNLPQSAILYQLGLYQYGFNKKEPTFLYFKPYQSLRSEGFQFSMRIY